MTTEELRQLYEASMQRSLELEEKHRRGERLSRKDCDEMRHCTQRIGVVAKELWIQLGKPDLGPGHERLHKPIPLSPLPKSMRPLDLTNRDDGGIH